MGCFTLLQWALWFLKFQLLNISWFIALKEFEVETLIPENMERIIAKEAEAERIKRAIIVKSEGEVGAAQKLADAANILSSTPGAMHLRTLATLNDLSGDKSNTIIFAIPVEVLESFKNAQVIDTVKKVIKK